MDDTLFLILIFAISFGFVMLEELLSSYIGISSLLGVLSLCIFIRYKNQELASRLMPACNRIWILAEMLLFVLVGACIKINYASKYFITALILILISLSFRSIAVNISLIKTNLNLNERIFTTISSKSYSSSRYRKWFTRLR